MRGYVLIAIVLIAIVLLALTHSVALADGGGVRGFVHADQDAGLESARVTIVGLYGTFQTTAGRNGFFVFLSVPPGKYDVYASKEGYVPGCRVGVVVEPDEVRDVTILALVRSTVISGCRRISDESLVDPDATADVYNVR